jgi:uncharacterized protein YhdP
MPNLELTSELLQLEAMEFSDLVFRSRTESNRFIIDRLDFARDQVNLRASGSWQDNPASNEQVSVLNVDIQGENLGQVVRGLGLGETFEQGKVEFNGQLGWSGPMMQIDWPTLIGEIDLRITDGFLRNVEPGAGRFVGLLSFSALPRRLFLDFGDVFNRGMKFDKIKGTFQIQGETLSTQNASLDSDSAKIRIRGDTNLRHQTYDQVMTVIPKVGETLPVIGALTAGNTVGWGLLLLQKIFRKPIEKSVEIEYNVSGDWDDPQIVLIKKPDPEVDSETELQINP